ncbi:MAG: selenium cofactor biosynthesis protein YqeC, partial [Halobacteriota archaeon]
MDLRDAFDPRGVVSIVGAGGKKSTLYALASALEFAIVTATVRIPFFDDRVERLEVTTEPGRLIRTNERWPLGVVPDRDGDRERYLGYDPETIDALASKTDVPVLIKADGARTRWLKAPKGAEPQIPSGTDLVIPVASVRAVGRALGAECVHRPERVAAITGRSMGEPVRPEDVITVLTHECGGLKGVPEDARVIPLINMVDDSVLAATAREIATGALTQPRIERVVLGRMD